MATKPEKRAGRPPEGSKAMTVTVPLRLSSEIISAIDQVIDKRGGSASRNSVLRDMIVKGLRVEGEDI